MLIQKKTLVMVVLSTSLVACSDLNPILNTDTPVDYRTTVAAQPLTLPPGLSNAQLQQAKYSISSQANSYLAYQQAKKNVQQHADQVLPQVPGVQLKDNGVSRWLEINEPAQVVYNQLITFWAKEGFTLAKEQPAQGILVTDWAENRSGLKPGFIQRLLGKIGDMISDSGIRDRFTTRLERHDGKTNVYITHERMIETQTSRDGSTFKWLPAKDDPNVNAIMMQELMVYLGYSRDQAKAVVSHPAPVQAMTTVPHAVTLQGDQLVFDMDAQTAWKRLGTAIDALGFTVDARNAQQLSYVVRYLDTDNGVARKQGNALTRLFGNNGNVTPIPYTLQVKSEGAHKAVVSVSSKTENSRLTYRRILTAILEKLEQ